MITLATQAMSLLKTVAADIRKIRELLEEQNGRER